MRSGPGAALRTDKHALVDQLEGDELAQDHDFVVALVGLLGFFDAVREELVAALEEIETGGQELDELQP